jgi:Zn-dependent oligopeptidase
MTFDHSVITPSWIERHVEDALARADAIVDDVLTDRPPTFEGVLLPLQDVLDLLTRVAGHTAFMGYVHPEAAVRAAGKAAEERLSKWEITLVFRDDLAARIRAFAETDEAEALDGERARLLAFALRDLRRAGHDLEQDARARLQELTNRLVELGVRFEQHIAEHHDHLDLTPEELDGLPEWYADQLEPGEEEGTLRVTMAYPHVIPFMENARRRDLRAEILRRFTSRAVEGNRPILEEALRIRREIAGLFGLSSWSEHVLEERMARHPRMVETFYEDLRPALTEAAREEIARMTELLVRDGEEPPLQVYDWRYYDTMLRRTEYGVDQSEVSAYFPLEQVLGGLFDITGHVFGLRYEPLEAAGWHPDARTYRIVDAASDEPIAEFHMDLFPREGKFSHAAAFTLVPGRRTDAGYQRPVSAIVANFTKPAGGRPSLLQHEEVETLFHEFGHVLHQTLTKAAFPRFSGTNTERDFVEAPSQIMQHWVWKADVLRRFARHHETGDPIPPELVDRLVEARRLNVALTTLRQMSFGMLDLALHGTDGEPDLDAVLRETTSVALLPFHEDTFFPASFGHLFGYDAGYYGYLWSEVYGDDMFSRFEAEGYLDPGVGMDYRRKILERGGTADGMDLLHGFLGREPNNAAFLRKLGIDT